ncbi:hypothetical protein M2161_008967 [Streptomyces sp. SAI-133]|uniref:hypothetical protein n=1 Tax=unclassified Streptomyces TaxID=2593676 RepID=UPI002475C7D8|nr:hypothetical protein [Streptomyces sp. SAI-133]MDH6589861.1 hypothetical protein [Streptomyces sp. SAI-133]
MRQEHSDGAVETASWSSPRSRCSVSVFDSAQVSYDESKLNEAAARLTDKTTAVR